MSPPGHVSVVLRAHGDRGAPVPGAGLLGLKIFLASLSMLFLGGVVAYWVVRGQAHAWPPQGAPRLPLGLWLGCLPLAACSVLGQRALSAIRAGDAPRMQRLLRGALAAALAFVALQGFSWWAFYSQDTTFHRHLYGFTYYMLTGLHGLHVVGGLVVLLWVLWRARAGAYGWAAYAGVRLAVTYWHFLGAVWLVLLTVLWLGS